MSEIAEPVIKKGAIMQISKADIDSLVRLRKKIRLNVATSNEYEDFKTILKKYKIDLDKVVAKYQYSSYESYVKKREKAKQKGSLETEGKVLGAILGKALGLIKFFLITDKME